MTLAEALDTTRIPRVAGLTGRRTAFITTRPCRAPHHTITIADVGLIGGGQVPLPGEASRARDGVLCLDACPSARGMSSKGYTSRSRRVLYRYNLPRVLDLNGFAELAIWLMTASGSGEAR